MRGVPTLTPTNAAPALTPTRQVVAPALTPTSQPRPAPTPDFVRTVTPTLGSTKAAVERVSTITEAVGVAFARPQLKLTDDVAIANGAKTAVPLLFSLFPKQ